MINMQELPKLSDSISYIYIEHAIIERENNAVVAIDATGRVPIPAASVVCLLLGPGTSVTHAAIRALCDNGCMAVWCGENASRFYAAGLGETRSARNLLQQARVCMDDALHLEAARAMYQMRFPETNTKGMSLQQLRGMEGARVRQIYKDASARTGVPWHGRDYSRSDWSNADPVNRALSQANAILYGVCHASIVSLGYSPGLGFIHTGKQLSFVYDIADLYKAETSIPAAFDAVQSGETNLGRAVRVCCRDRLSDQRILSRVAADIAAILDVSSSPECADMPEETGKLWNGSDSVVSGGVNYAEQKDQL